MDVYTSSASQAIKRDRIFKKGSGWFFDTREGINMGPFPDQSSAELEMVNYVRSMRSNFRRAANH